MLQNHCTIPTLPQNDTAANQKQRRFELSLSKTEYNYMFSYLEPLPIAASVPKGEGFSAEYEFMVLQTFLPLVKNFKHVVISLLKQEVLDDLPTEVIASIEEVESAYEEVKLQLDGEHHSRLNVIKDISEIYKLLTALSKVPKELEAAIRGVAQLPNDVIKLISGLEVVFTDFEKQGATAFLKSTLYETLATSGGRNYLKAKSDSCYQDILSQLPLPQNLAIEAQAWMPKCAATEHWQQDWYFGYMQTAGFNTTNLKGVQLSNSFAKNVIVLADLLQKVPLTDAMLQSVVGDAEITLSLAADKGLLYAVDYAQFADIEGSELHELERYPAAPIAVFYWNSAAKLGAGYPAGGALQPVAIQLAQQHDCDTAPIFTPNDYFANADSNGNKWAVAKSYIQNACAIQHEVVAHLGACHLTVEPMILAANRQLPAAHPIHVLLKPHFRFTIQINDSAIHSLIVPGGVVASVLSPDHQSVAKILVDAHEQWRFDEQFPPKLFEQRGVSKLELADFPFRDDTLDNWQAIVSFVRQYLALYYQGDNDEQRLQSLLQDNELQGWINEMVNPKYAGIKGMFGLVESADIEKPFQIDSFDYLVEVVALIIYTASAQHAGVNYAQYPLMSYIPSVSGTLYAKPPQANDTLEDNAHLNWLPPLDVALYQASFGYLLSNVQFDKLGHYSADPRQSYFADKRVAPLVTAFQMQLNQVEIDIYQRNQHRPFPYLLQLPSMIPNSISI